VDTGEIVGLVGPNGAGKTTALRCMSGIVPPDAGVVRIGGHPLDERPLEAKRRLAFVPDEPRLFDYLTAHDHLVACARVYGVEHADGRIDELLGEFELGDRARSFPSELSRGMKQKLMVAMAMLHDPEAILLDEPLTGLDPGAMRRMKERIRRSAANGKSVLLSSHMLHLVEELCGRIVILAKGRKVLEGSLAEIRDATAGHEAEQGLEEIFLRAVGDGGTDPEA
jgi:ABC-2 type transport system ATP-binding protein